VRVLQRAQILLALEQGIHDQQIETYEYKRNGTRNLFVAVEPLAGWR